MFEKLPQFKLEIGKFDLDLGRIISENKFEGTRWGIGAFTNENLLRWFNTGGYIGYGTKDKRLKYGFSGLNLFLRCYQEK
ncbi:MAG: hypothetical protein LBB41_06850 [Prevotellaceae bacterium]|nr:hypothetical protein [Prevotellaceae bacterium]